MRARVEKYAPTRRSQRNPAVDDLLKHLDSTRPLDNDTFCSRAEPWKPPYPTCLVAWRDDDLPVGFLAGRLAVQGTAYDLDGMASILELIGTRRGHGTNGPGGLSLGEQLVVHFVELAAAEGSRHLLLRIGASAAEVQHTMDFVNRAGFAQRGGWWWRPIEGIAGTESPDS